MLRGGGACMTSTSRRWLSLALPLAMATGCGGTVTDLNPDASGGVDCSAPSSGGCMKTPGDATTGGSDATTGRDTGVTPTDGSSGGIPCGKSTCSPGTQECCVAQTAGTCTPRGECDGGIAVTCSSPKSCSTAGDVCCASFGGGGTTGGISVTCTSATDCHGFQLCQSDMDCPDGESCDPGLDGLDVCRMGFDGGHHHPDGGFHPPDGGFHPPDGGFVPPDAGPG
jgi:hypothetical protein